MIAEREHQDNVHNALYAELAKGVFLPATREKFRSAIADLVSRGAEAVILGCTEFGVLVKSEDSPVPLIDTTVEHARAAVDMALADLPPRNTPPLKHPHISDAGAQRVTTPPVHRSSGRLVTHIGA